MIFLKKNLAYAKKLDTSQNKGQVKILNPGLASTSLVHFPLFSHGLVEQGISISQSFPV